MFPKECPAGANPSEEVVYRALRGLSDDWCVVHNFCFVVPPTATKRALNGQIDFILLHRSMGMIVLEAKGGGYEVEDGVWYTFPSGRREVMDRSPFAQAMTNRYELADYISRATGERGLSAGHAVAFPDGAPRGHLGAEAPSAITLSGVDLADAKRAIAQVCSHWFAGGSRGFTENQFKKVLSLVAPTASIATDRRYNVDVTMVDVRALTEKQIQLTDEQLRVVEATQQKAHVAILGAAGTGKTVIAVKRAEVLASQGRRVLLLADQRYLHDSLRRQRGLKHANVVLGTPEEVILELEVEAGSRAPSDELWERLLHVAEAGVGFDVVIVDEAQNLDDDLLEALENLSRSSFHVYADPYQRDTQGMWRPPGNPQAFWLTRNCRNSLSIAKLVAKLGGGFTPLEGASGPRPRFIEAASGRVDLTQQTCGVVTDLLEHVPGTDIAVLTCSPTTSDLSRALMAEGVRVARKPGDEGVTLLPADAFRGCESPVVVLVAGAEHACGESATRNHYVATSRAVADLTIIADQRDWASYLYLVEMQ